MDLLRRGGRFDNLFVLESGVIDKLNALLEESCVVRNESTPIKEQVHVFINAFLWYMFHIPIFVQGYVSPARNKVSLTVLALSSRTKKKRICNTKLTNLELYQLSQEAWQF